MRSRFRPSPAMIVACIALLVALGGTTYAATGGNFILGKSNTASSTSTLSAPIADKALTVTNDSSKAGATALGLNVAKGHPPFRVNSGAKVANLNADKLDGYDSTALRTTAYTWTKSVPSAVPDLELNIPLGPGTYVIGYDAYMIGGGSTGSVAGCYFWRHRGTDYVYYGETRYATVTSNAVGASGSSSVSLVAGDELRLYCYAPTNWTTDPTQPIHVYAIRTAATGGGALRTAPSGARIVH